MLKRKIINKLLYWKKSTNKKALLIKGARQIGKTTTIRDFGTSYYKHFIEVNFEKTPLAKQAFAGNRDADTVIMNLSAMGFGPFVKGETLVFFDEIQSCPEARTAIKFLVEDGRFDYIESGSLLGINYKDVSSYPVGFEQQESMYALDFEEFLWACGIGEEVIEALAQCYREQKMVPQFIHEQIMSRFRQYLIVGGMPEVVAAFFETKNLSHTTVIQGNIINSYRDDISKYADKDKLLAKSVFDAIPSQLAKANKRFILADLEKGASQRKYGDATQWLVDAGVAYYSFNVSALELPFSMTEKRNMYRLFMHDTGLLCRQSLKDLQFSILNGDIAVNKGALAENFVAAELSKHGRALHYYDRKSRQELDFLCETADGVMVLEVKSGKDYKRHASLDAVLAQQPKDFNQAIVLSVANLEHDGNVLYLPLYMTMFL